jgi:hypothetical protein
VRTTAKPAAALALGAAWLVHAAPLVTANRKLRQRLFPLLSGQVHSGAVAVTFDDGPDARSTPAVLDALDRAGWRCTFFFLGEMVRRDRALALEVRDLRQGGTVLLHDSDCTSAPGSWRSTIAALPRLADAFAERSWPTVTLSEHLPA